MSFLVVLPENSESQNVLEVVAQNRVGFSSSLNKEKYNMSEMMFSMERGGCAAAQANLENPNQNSKPGEKRKTQSDRDPTEAVRQNDNTHEDTHKDTKNDHGSATDKNLPLSQDTSKTGQAPWQEGVLERLRTELTPQEYNMYVVHHGRMLVAFGQIEACTPREKDFVYGSLEPIPVQTLRSFKVLMARYNYPKI